ncbi:MAG: MoaD/ThiS family protein [Actinomycetota bacterium]|nr:MoaD/ThiS family protein [Actinomycetota bacterium]
MTVRVRVPAALRELSGGEATLALELGEGATMADLLDAVAALHPALERRVRNERGELRTHVNVFVGEDDVRSLGGVGTTLTPDAEVSILAAISGGA